MRLNITCFKIKHRKLIDWTTCCNQSHRWEFRMFVYWFRLKAGNWIDWVSLTVLIFCRDNIVSNVVHHDKPSNGSTEYLVLVLTIAHAGKHSSLLLKRSPLFKSTSLAPDIMHEKRPFLSGIYQQVLMWNRQYCVQTINYFSLVFVLKGLNDCRIIWQFVVRITGTLSADSRRPCWSLRA